jgi:hypothetical protein
LEFSDLSVDKLLLLLQTLTFLCARSRLALVGTIVLPPSRRSREVFHSTVVEERRALGLRKLHGQLATQRKVGRDG